MRRIAVLVLLALCVVACGEKADPLAFPSAPQGRLLTPIASGPTGTTGSAPTSFAVAGCPGRDRAMCETAAATADALVQADLGALGPLSRSVTVRCEDVDPDVYPQCDGRHRTDVLEGYVVAGAEPATFVDDRRHYDRQLRFMQDGLDPEFSDDYGTGAYSIVGLATCEPGVRYQLVYLVGLGDPNSTLPADRFLGTAEITADDHGWAISRLALDILSDWQLAFDDPIKDAGCGKIEPWAE
jgi:hypothetical protein